MNSNTILKICSLLIAFYASIITAHQPSYQVSLYAQLHPRSPPIHLCNGAIIQSRLILTTASCVHYHFASNSPAIRIQPKMLSVIAGSSTPFAEELNFQVSDILLAKDFNYTTGENDLALVYLSDKLPLDTRKDIKWIILDDAEIYDGPSTSSCLANFYVRNSQDGTQNYIQSEQLPILDSELCRYESEYPIERGDDICSLYYLPTDFNCNSFATLEHYNEDRGTGLVCENNLVGILSTILPLQNKIDCTERPIRAYYTSLAPHLEWIYGIIGQEELKMFEQGTYMSSSPYAGETFAFVESASPVTDFPTKPEPTKPLIADAETSNQFEQGEYMSSSSSHGGEIYGVVQPIITEPGSTLAQVSGNPTKSTESSVAHNSSHRAASFNFLPELMGIYLLLRSISPY